MISFDLNVYELEKGFWSKPSYALNLLKTAIEESNNEKHRLLVAQLGAFLDWIPEHEFLTYLKEFEKSADQAIRSGSLTSFLESYAYQVRYDPDVADHIRELSLQLKPRTE